jgi:hypothetical protein
MLLLETLLSAYEKNIQQSLPLITVYRFGGFSISLSPLNLYSDECFTTLARTMFISTEIIYFTGAHPSPLQ